LKNSENDAAPEGNVFMKKCCAQILLTVFLLWAPAGAIAQTALLGINVDGAAPIQNSDVAEAREQAVRNALEKAISQAVDKVLDDQAAQERYQAVRSVVIGSSDKYINHYRLLSENRGAEDYSVSINAVVLMSLLKTDLAGLGVLSGEGLGVTTVRVFHRNLETYSRYEAFCKYLQSRSRLVKQLRPWRLEWRQAVFEVQVFGDPAALANELAQTGRYRVDVSRKEDRIMEIFLEDKEGVK